MSAPSAAALTIHEATRATDGTGGVIAGKVITRAEAIVRRQSGDDVVVCGDDPFAVAREAYAIESSVGR